MKKHEDELFALVKSLDRSEKGYFKKFAARYGSKTEAQSYLLLFDLLDKMEDYDEQKLRKQFEKKSQMANLSAQKNYLFQQLMKALRNYHSSKNFRYELLEAMQDMEIFSSKGLVGLMRKKYDYARELCKSKDVPLNLLQLNYYRQMYLIHTYEAGQNEPMEGFRQEQERIMHEYQLNLHISRLEEQVRNFYFSYQNLPAVEVRKLTKDFPDNELFKNMEVLSLRQQSMLCNVLNVYYSLVGEEKKSVGYLQKRVHLIEQINSNPLQSGLDYIITLFNLSLGLMNIGQMADAVFYQQKLEQLKTSDKGQERYRNETAFRLRLTMLSNQYSSTSDPREIMRAEQEYLSQPVPDKYDTRNTNARHFSFLYYLSGNYDKSLHWCNLAIDQSENRFDSVFISNALLKAVIYYERKELSLLQSVASSAIYHIRRYHTGLEQLCSVFHLLTKAAEETSAEGKRVLLLQLAEQAVTTDEEDLKLVVWCRAQLTGVRYLKAKEEKQQNEIAA